MNRRVATLTLVAIAALSACSGGSESSAPETTVPLETTQAPETTSLAASLQEQCTQLLVTGVAGMLDNNTMQGVIDAWGVQGPVFQLVPMIAGTVTKERFRKGMSAAVDLMTSNAASACTDGDILNAVMVLQDGDPGFSFACFDGDLPQIDANDVVKPCLTPQE